MTWGIADYFNTGLVTTLGGIVAYVFRDHTKRDDERFKALEEEHTALGDKLDAHFMALSGQLTNIAFEAGRNAAAAATAALGRRPPFGDR